MKRIALIISVTCFIVLTISSCTQEVPIIDSGTITNTVTGEVIRLGMTLSEVQSIIELDEKYMYSDSGSLLQFHFDEELRSIHAVHS